MCQGTNSTLEELSPMKQTPRWVIRCLWNLVVISLCAASYAAENDKTAAAQLPPAGAADAASIQALKQQLAEQKAQIDELRLLLLDQKKQIDSLRVQTAPASEEAAAVTRERAKSEGLGLVASTAAILPPVPAASLKPDPLSGPQAVAPQQVAPAKTDQSGPLNLRIGDAYITPVGFMDLTNTWRSTNSGASLATNFGNFPYNNTPAGRLTEDKLTAQNSRIGFRVDTVFKGWRVLGYYEGDFVGQIAANNTQVTSNPMGYRIRLYWGDVRKGSFEYLAGQSWSLMTPNRNGMSALPGDLFYGNALDVNYLNGLTWGRIPGMRFIYHGAGDKFIAGLSIENATQYVGGSGGGSLATLPAALAPTNYFNEIDANQTNDIVVPNVHPDFIGKIVVQPNRHVHLEVAGVVSSARTFMPSTQKYFSETGGGVAFNANLEVFKNFRLVTNNFWGDGAGRYMFGQAGNFIIRADGSLSPLHSGSMVQGLEYTRKNTQFYAYYGGIYITRNTALDANGKTLIGYGYTGSPNSQNRTIQEATTGLIQTLWRDPKYGGLQLMAQYAYFFRNPWYVAPNGPKNAHETAVWFNVRYLLPGAPPPMEH
jgi:hypothetical protein